MRSFKGRIKKLIMEKQQIKIPDQDVIHSAWLVQLERSKAKTGYYYLPDNYAEFIVVLEGSITREVIGTPQKSSLSAGKAYMASVRSRGTIWKAEEDVVMLMIKIHPNMQFGFCSEAFLERRNAMVEIDQENEPWTQGPLPVMARRACHFLIFSAVTATGDDQVVEKCLRLIKSSHGEIRIRELVERVGLCKSSLEERFNREVGMSPKEFCKIEKLNHFMANYYDDRRLNLTQLTFKSGYYDQSHLIKEFRYFVDLSPGKFLKEANKLEIPMRL